MHPRFSPAPAIVYLNTMSHAARVLLTHYLRWLYGDTVKALDNYKLFKGTSGEVSAAALDDVFGAVKLINDGAKISVNGIDVIDVRDASAPWAAK